VRTLCKQQLEEYSRLKLTQCVAAMFELEEYRRVLSYS
jgi:hypothetical protein